MCPGAIPRRPRSRRVRRFSWFDCPRASEVLGGFPRGRIERDTAGALVIWGVAGLTIAILATFFIVWKLNRPLGELRRGAESSAREAIPAGGRAGPAELARWPRAFNQMKEDLQRNQRERATFLAGVSHDLAHADPPCLRLEGRDARRQGRKLDAAMVEDLDDMNAIIDQFIDFTEQRSRRAACVGQPVGARRDLPSARHAPASRCAASSAKIADSPAAAAHDATPRGQPHRQRRAPRRRGRFLGAPLRSTARRCSRCSIADPEFPQRWSNASSSPLPAGDEARSGSSGAGLGLAIANRVAAVHGGRLDTLPREGGGLEARVTLPWRDDYSREIPVSGNDYRVQCPASGDSQRQVAENRVEPVPQREFLTFAAGPAVIRMGQRALPKLTCAVLLCVHGACD